MPIPAALLNEVNRLQAAQRLDADLLHDFSRHGDERAFQLLVERHGPMVLRVCRNVLGDGPAAEDAFQATFLVFARKARLIAPRHPGAVAGWLFSSAHRIAQKARTAQRRRCRHESSVRPRDVKGPLDEMSARELCQALDDELARLPDIHRLPLLFCFWQGLTQDEAALRLGVSAGAIKGRLERGRARLAARLAKRGVAPAVLLTTAAGVSLPQELIAKTIEVIRPEVKIPAAIAALAGSLAPRAMKLVAVAAMLVVVAGGFGLRDVWLTASPLPDPPAKDQPEARTEPPAKPKEVLRDRFNDPLPEGAVVRLGTLALRHGGEISDLQFSVDSESVYSRGGGIIRQWQIKTGHEIKTIDLRPPAPDEVRTQIITPDGQTVVAVFGDRLALSRPTRAEVWNAKTMEKLREFTINEKDGRFFTPDQVIASPGGKYVAARRTDGLLQVLNCTQSSLVFSIPRTELLAFSQDDRMIVTSDARDELMVWETATGREVKRVGTNTGHTLQSAISPDGKWLATTAYTLGTPKPFDKNLSRVDMIPDPFIRIWNLEKGELVGKIEAALKGHMAFAPDGRSLFVLCRDSFHSDSSVRRYEVPSGKMTREFPKQVPDNSIMAISPNGKILSAGTSSGSVRIWNLEAERELTVGDGHDDTISSLDFTLANDRLRSHDYQRTMIEWDLKTTQALRRVVCPSSPRRGFWASANGRFQAGDNPEPEPKIATMIVVDTVENRIVRDFGPTPAGMSAMAVTQDIQRLTTVSGADSSKRVETWSIASGKLLHSWELKELKNDSNTWPYLFHLAGERLLVIWQAKVSVFEIASGRKLATWDPVEKGVAKKEGARGLAFYLSQDGERVACVLQQSGEIVVCETTTGRVIRRVSTEGLVNYPVRFSANGTLLAACSAGLSPAVHIWDIQTGEKRHEFAGHRGEIMCLAFRPDGLRLASGSRDSTVLIWDLTRK